MRDNLLPIWRRKVERGHRGDYGVTSGYCVDVEHQNFEWDTTIFKYETAGATLETPIWICSANEYVLCDRVRSPCR